MSTLGTLIVALLAARLLFGLGYREKSRNDRNVASIPVRINVTGTRGKSTATRLITAILTQAGYKTVGKTTGTAARMIYWNHDKEKVIQRKPRGVNLTEQIHVIHEAAQLKAEALVCECMAIRPEFQKVHQDQMLKANLTVIVNVLDDHLDEMGPTTEQIAWAFGETIPYYGTVVIPNCEFTDYFRRIAKKRHTKVFLIDDTEITQEYLDSFDYQLFDHNCAVGLTVARALGISDEIAYTGMRKAHPDPGALRITRIARGAIFINAFAANEPSSCLEIWESVKGKIEKAFCENPIVVMNCRADRSDRTVQFVRDFFPYIPNMTLLVIGEQTSCCKKAYKTGKYPNIAEFKSIEGKRVSAAIDYLLTIMDNRVIFGVGNIHGIGEEFIHALMNVAEHSDSAQVQAACSVDNGVGLI